MSLLGIVALLCAALWVLGWRRRRSAAAQPYLALISALLVWTLAYMWELGSGTLEAMVLASKVQYLAIPLVPVAMLGLALTYTGRRGWRRPRFLILAHLVPVTVMLLAWTNERHHLIWREIGVAQGDGWSLLQLSYGSFFWIYVAYSYLLLLTALGLIVDSAVRRKGLWRRQSILIGVGVSAPFAGNILHIFGIAPLQPLDPTVFLFVITGLTLGVAALHPRFLTMAPVARDLVLDLISDGVVVIDHEASVTDLNAVAASVLRVSQAGAVGQDAELVLGPLRSVLEASMGTTTEHVVETPGGPRTYACTRVALDASAPAQMGSALVMHDVTEQAAFNRALEDARTELEDRVRERTARLTETNQRLSAEIRRREEAQEHERALVAQLFQAQKLETIGTLAGGIAHDFNNLLAVILGYTEIVLSGPGIQESSREDLGQVMEAAQRAKALTGRILAFSRPSQVERRPLDLGVTIRQSLELLRAVTPTTVDIHSAVDPETPLAVADATQLQQVLMNLCSNAAHAMSGGGTLVVEVGPCDAPARTDASLVAGHEANGWVAIRVRDTGEGMGQATLDRLFEPFFTTKAPGHGTGLGLSVVHDIVMTQGGEISVESELGVGTTFTVFLPVTEADVIEEAPTVDEAWGGAGVVLLVDDEPQLVRLGERTLRGEGYTVVGHTDPAAALAEFRSDPMRFDLLVTDHDMPGLPGMALAREVRALRPEFPVILMSGHPVAVRGELPGDMGPCEVLQKPASRTVLLATIRSAVEGQRALRLA
jgi:signal transduction histidine kinase/CheY-like chemotaxis protein